MRWRDSAEVTVSSLAALGVDHLSARLTGPKLAVLAKAVGVRSTGRKADVAALIVARCDLLARMRTLGDDPHRIARIFRKKSLVLYARGLGCFTGLTKYGLAATIVSKRDQIYRTIRHELENAT